MGSCEHDNEEYASIQDWKSLDSWGTVNSERMTILHAVYRATGHSVLRWKKNLLRCTVSSVSQQCDSFFPYIFLLSENWVCVVYRVHSIMIKYGIYYFQSIW